MKILDVGCGNRKYLEEGSTTYGIDKYNTPCVDKIWDAEKENIPYPNDYFDKVVSICALEEISDVQKVMKEIWRVTKPNGIVIINVPYFRSCTAFMERNKSFFRLDSFGYECIEDDYYRWTTDARFKRIKNKFQMVSDERSIFVFLRILNPIINLPYFKYFFMIFLSHIIIPQSLEFELQVIKIGKVG